MEKRTILEQDALWSSKQITPINAITIELQFPMEMHLTTSENSQHNNFSIRGYAAEMRRRYPKAFDPFEFDDVPSGITQGPEQSSNGQENVHDADHNISDAADLAIEQLEPSVIDTDTDDSEYKLVDIPGIDTITQEDTDDDFDDLMPLSQLRKTVTRNIPNILHVENTNSCDDGQRVVGAAMSISRDLGQNTHEVNVAPHEMEDMSHAMSSSDRNKQHDLVENVNNALSDNEESQEHVSSTTVSRRKERKVRMISDLLRVEGAKNQNHVITGIIGSTGAPRSLTHDQLLSNDVIMDPNSPRKGKTHQEGDGSLGQVTITEKFNDPVTDVDAEPCGQDNAPSGAGLELEDTAHYLKRGTEGNQSLVTKKSKSAQISERKSACVRSGDFQSCSMFDSFGSSTSAAVETNNNIPDNQPTGETCRIISDVTQTELQIPNCTTLKGDSSGTWLPTLEGHHTWTDSNRNPDGGETSSVQRKTNLCLAESIVPRAYAQDLLMRRWVLDLNERDTPSSSNALPNGSFHEPNEGDYSLQKILENERTWNSNIKQCEQSYGKAVMKGSSDDFPPDILELTAKHQYERTLGINVGSYLVPPRPPITTTRSFPEIQNIRNTQRPLAAVGYSNSNSFSFPNAWRVMTTPTTNMGAEQGNAIDYYQTSRNHFNMGRFDEHQRNIFNAFQQNQQNISTAIASYVRPVPQGNVILERSSLFRSTVFPFGPHSLQKFSAQTPKSTCDRGKTISDIKADDLKKTKEDSSFSPRSEAFDLNHEFMEPCSDDDIPAMQLLGFKSEKSTGSTFNVGTNKFLDKLLGRQSLHLQERERLRKSSQFSGYVADVSDQDQSFSKEKNFKQKSVLVYPDNVEDTMHNSTSNHTKIYIDLETESGHENVRILPPEEICSINRNPADFTSLEAGNEFTIYRTDIKCRKRKYSKSNTSL